MKIFSRCFESEKIEKSGDLQASLVKGQEKPEFQGFKANSALQGDYSPVYTLKYTVKGGNVKIATLFYPLYAKECPCRCPCPITEISVSTDTDGDNITVHLNDGSKLRYGGNIV